MGIRDQPTPPRCRWQNGYAERLIGSIRRECLDHVVVCHLRHLLLSYMTMAPARIYPWRRMRRSRVPSNRPSRFFVAQISAGCTTNTSGFDFRQAQVGPWVSCP
jgi:transposase InsO family protein